MVNEEIEALLASAINALFDMLAPDEQVGAMDAFIKEELAQTIIASYPVRYG